MCFRFYGLYKVPFKYFFSAVRHSKSFLFYITLVVTLHINTVY